VASFGPEADRRAETRYARITARPTRYVNIQDAMPHNVRR
jgi:hypothetical protein